MDAWLKYYIALVISILLLGGCGHTQGAVTISPSGTASVCSRDQLELTCTIADSESFALLLWNITLIPENATAPLMYHRTMESSSPNDQTHELSVVDSTRLTFSRISAQNSFPFVSRLLINPVSSSLNGAEVSCMDGMTSESTSVVVISIINGKLIPGTERVNLTEEYEKDAVSITLEWTQLNSSYSYHISIVPPLPVNFSMSMRAQIRVPYNTPHNVSILVSSCGQKSVTIFYEEVYYVSENCGNPVDQVNELVRVSGFVEPAVVESNVVFTCPPGLILTGPNSSTCMGNGEWEPDPKEVNCSAKCGPPSPLQNGYIIPYTSILEGATVTYVCWNIHQRGHRSQCEEVYVTAICNNQGQWEPNTDDICAESRGALLSQDGTVAVASSVSTFIISSIAFFTFGYLCRHYRQKQEQTLPTPANSPTPGPVYENVLPQQNTEQELELKENIAYGPLTTIISN